MGEEPNIPEYQFACGDGVCEILEKDKITGKTASLGKVFLDAETVLKIVDILNKNSVSTVHAKDVIRDFIVSRFSG